jgi:stage II sporulation protein D
MGKEVSDMHVRHHQLSAADTDRRPRHPALAALAATLVVLAGVTVPAAPAAAAVPTSFTLQGSGFGHGVGMPQYGAYQMAREGASAVDILQYYYRGTQAPYVTTPRGVYVQVYGPEPYGFRGYADTATTTTITVTGGSWRLRSSEATTLASGAGTKTLQVTTTAGGRARVTVDGRRYYGSQLRLHWSGTRYYRPTSTPAVVTVRGAHGSYRHGLLSITARAGIPNITNHLLLNTEYLYGIAEMPSSWGLNGGDRALRAQAITARSYAISKMTYKSACACHVVDDVRDQYFSGWKKENEGTGGRYGAVWKRAVNATLTSTTRARVLRYQGSSVAAHYYSSSGGRTANSEDVWSSVVPYERSVADPYSRRAPGNSYASWTRSITQSQARALFGLPNVQTIRVTARWSSGQMRTLTATAPDGTVKRVTGKADQMRSVVGRRTTAGSVPAAWITGIRAVS